MSEVYFYQIPDREPFDHLRRLLTLSYQKGWRVAVRAGSAEMIESLDRNLWLVPQNSFLPHGQSGGPFDADQPILLTTQKQTEYQADSLVLFDGAELGNQEVENYARVSIVFRTRQDDEMAKARQNWSQLSNSGVCIQYWVQEADKWSKKVEKNYPQA